MLIEKMFADYVQKNMQNKTISPLPKQKLLYVVSSILKKCSKFQAVEDELLCVLHVSKKSLINLKVEQISLLEFYLVKSWLYSKLETVREDVYLQTENDRLNKRLIILKNALDECGHYSHSHNFGIYNNSPWRQWSDPPNAPILSTNDLTTHTHSIPRELYTWSNISK